MGRLDAIGFERCLPIMLQLLDESDPQVSQLVLSVFGEQALRKTEPFPIDVKRRIVSCLANTTDTLIIQAAISTIQTARIADEEAVVALNCILEHSNRHLAIEAAIALIELQAPSSQAAEHFALVQLENADPMIRSLAAEALGLLGVKAAEHVPRLVAILNYPDTDKAAARAIAKITGDLSDLIEIADGNCQSSDSGERLAGRELHSQIARMQDNLHQAD